VVARGTRNQVFVALAWLNLGYHDWVVGDLAATVADVVQGLTMLRATSVNDPWEPWIPGDGIGLAGLLALERGEARRGARLLGAAERYGFRPAGRYPDERERYAAIGRAARERLGDEGFVAATAEGQAMTLDQAISSALEAGSP
jgi:hypothetical protein